METLYNSCLTCYWARVQTAKIMRQFFSSGQYQPLDPRGTSPVRILSTTAQPSPLQAPSYVGFHPVLCPLLDGFPRTEIYPVHALLKPLPDPQALHQREEVWAVGMVRRPSVPSGSPALSATVCIPSAPGAPHCHTTGDPARLDVLSETMNSDQNIQFLIQRRPIFPRAKGKGIQMKLTFR